ncbi:hypothetical protein HDV62DRAFT_105236 [Trichoderma sp. SZMC 28011]
MENFSSLPLELRSQIWLLTVEPRRTVEVRFKYTLVVDESDGRDFFEAIWDAPPELVYTTSPTPVPAALHTCREARNSIARKYERAFTGGTEPRYVWVNFDLDIISIDKSRFTWMKPEAPRIRWLKFEREIDEHYVYEEQFELHMFCDIEELTVVRLGGEMQRWHQEIISWPCPTDRVWFINAKTDEKITWAESQRRCDKQLNKVAIKNQIKGSE